MGEQVRRDPHKRRAIDNFLAGTSQSPDRVKDARPSQAHALDEAVRPTSGPPAR